MSAPARGSGDGAGTASKGDVQAAAVPWHDTFLAGGTSPSPASSPPSGVTSAGVPCAEQFDP